MQIILNKMYVKHQATYSKKFFDYEVRTWNFPEIGTYLFQLSSSIPTAQPLNVTLCHSPPTQKISFFVSSPTNLKCIASAPGLPTITSKLVRPPSKKRRAGENDPNQDALHEQKNKILWKTNTNVFIEKKKGSKIRPRNFGPHHSRKSSEQENISKQQNNKRLLWFRCCLFCSTKPKKEEEEGNIFQLRRRHRHLWSGANFLNNVQSMKLLWGGTSRLFPVAQQLSFVGLWEKMMNDLSIPSGELGKWQTGTLLLEVFPGFHPAYVS